jgi:hypothetical protein
MLEQGKPVRVAINVMRARLTLVGFNIAIVSFQIVFVGRLAGGIVVPGMGHEVHIGADIALFISMALSLIALVAFIISSAFDEVGVCTHWSLVAGDLLMYLSLAHTASGFFSPLSLAIGELATKLPDHFSEINTLRAAVRFVGGIAWFLAAYVGPLVSLVRSPFPRRTNGALAVDYVITAVGVAWVGAQATLVEMSAEASDTGVVVRVLTEMVQPFWW